MKLLQLNAWQLRLAMDVIDLINQESPDIICLQEICQADGEMGFITSLKELQEEIHYPHQYYSPLYNFRFMDENAEFGNALLSRQDIALSETIFTNGAYKDDFTFNHDDYNIRNLQHAVINCGGVMVNILNHHGYHVPEHKNGDEHTMKACKQIAEYIDNLDGPVILTGDFNLVPTSKSLEVLTGSLRNLSTEYHLTTTRNNLTRKNEVCDYIFVNDQIKVNNFYASEAVVSDHMGLILDFDPINA